MNKGDKEVTFIEELRVLINKHNLENESNTPDFILAQYVVNCLEAFNRATRWRTDWWGIDRLPIQEEKPQ